MIVVRILAGVFFLFAAIALASDVTRTFAGGGGLVVTSFAAHWKALYPQLLATTQQAVSTKLWPFVWDPLIWRLLLLPAWFLFAVIGFTLAFVGRRQRRANIFIN